MINLAEGSSEEAGPLETAASRVHFRPTVSVVVDARNTECRDVPLVDVLTKIQDGRWREQVEEIRRADAAGNKGDVDRLKRGLPGILCSGTFSKRSAKDIKEASGIICIDLDALGDRLATLRASIIADPHTYCLFSSPTGRGLKVLYRCDVGKPHLDSFNAAKTHIQLRCEVEVDEQCKDVSRLCFASWDAELYLNLDATRLAYPAAEGATHGGGGKGLSTRAESPPVVSALDVQRIKKLLECIPPRPDYDKWLRIASAVWSVLPKQVGCEVLHAWSPEEEANEYERKFEHRLTKIGLGSLIMYAREGGATPELYTGLFEKAAEGGDVLLPQGQTLLVLPGHNVSISESAQKIFTVIGKQRDLFYRGGRVHEVVSEDDGKSKLDLVEAIEFRSRMEKYGVLHAPRVGRNGTIVLQLSVCPTDTAQALLGSTEARTCLPNIAALSGCPVYADVGGLGEILGAGWHSLCGGLFVTGGELPPAVPLPEATAKLRALLEDFDFPTPGDSSRAIASFIAPALRFGNWLHRSLPIDIGEADASQSGKTYRQKIVAALYRETPNVVVQKSGGVGGMDESLAQKLIDGHPFILFDNLRARLDSPYLEAVLTANGSVPARVPHRGEVQVDSKGFVFQLTSNGVETTRDLGNRASVISIRKRPLNYKFRKYAEGELIEHVVAHQAYYLGCVFAVVREWVARGRPRTEEKRHSFSEWSQVLDWIVQNIFHAAPLLDGHDVARERICNPALKWLRELSLALRNEPLAREAWAAQLAEFAMERDILPPGVRPDADSWKVSQRIGCAMAALFKDRSEIDVDLFRITRSQKYSETAGKPGWVYTFAEINASKTVLIA